MSLFFCAKVITIAIAFAHGFEKIIAFGKLGGCHIRRHYREGEYEESGRYSVPHDMIPLHLLLMLIKGV